MGVSCTQHDGDANEHNAQSAASAEDQSGAAGIELKNPEVMEEDGALPSVGVSESDKSPKEDRVMSPVEQSKSVMEQSEQGSSALIEKGPVGPKPKKDKLARLRELGLEPPPVAKLCADEGAFIQLEPQQANPGEGTVLNCSNHLSVYSNEFLVALFSLFNQAFMSDAVSCVLFRSRGFKRTVSEACPVCSTA